MHFISYKKERGLPTGPFFNEADISRRVQFRATPSLVTNDKSTTLTFYQLRDVARYVVCCTTLH